MSPDDRTDAWRDLRHVRRTVVVADMVESVRLMKQHEADVIVRWRRFVDDVRTELLPALGGRLVRSLGDGLLLDFERPRDGVAAALALHGLGARLNAGRDAAAAIRLRVGVHVADIVVDELDIFGHGVNTAARIAGLAGPGEVLVSVDVRDELADGLDASVEDLGERYVKHLDEPLHVFRVGAAGDGDGGGGAPAAPPTAAIETSVAVLPFAAADGSPEAVALADLLADQVSVSLSRSASLAVISRFSASLLATRAASSVQLGRLLGANYLVSGRIHLHGQNVRVFAELLEAASGVAVWQQTFDGSLAEILGAGDDIVPGLVAEVGCAIVEREVRRASALPLPSLESHRLLMAAIGLIHRCSARDFARAQDVLELLAERHRRLPHAYTWLAQWHAMAAVQGLTEDRERSARRAVDHADRALDADRIDPLALTMKGLVLGFLRHRLDEADRQYQDALAVNPNEALAWLYTGTLRVWQGRGAEALEAARRALALAPWDPLRYHFDSLAGLAALAAGETELAAQWSARSLRANRRHTSTHRTLAIAQWKLGQHDAARATVADMMCVEPAFTVALYLDRFPGGRTDFARENAELLAAAGAPPG